MLVGGDVVCDTNWSIIAANVRNVGTIYCTAVEKLASWLAKQNAMARGRLKILEVKPGFG